MAILRFLLLEDNPLDAGVIQSTLLEGGIESEFLRVETQADFVQALETDMFDVILADYLLPGFDGIAGLRIAQTLCPDTPFIFVSAITGEEVAIEALKQGATDYVLKSNLKRLEFSVHRALRETAEKRRRQQAEFALRHSEARLRLMMDSVKEYAIFTLNAAAIVTSWSVGAERIFGYATAEIVGKDGRLLYAPEATSPDEKLGDRLSRELATARSQGRAENECWHLRQDGSRFWGSGFVLPLQDTADEVQEFIKILRDVTSQRQADERFRLLYDITSNLLAIAQPPTFMQNLFKKLAPKLGLDCFYNYVVEQKDDEPMLHLKAYAGIDSTLAEAIEWVPFGAYLCGTVAQTQQPLVFDQVLIATHPLAKLVHELGAKAYVGHPLIVQERLLGTLSFVSYTRMHFTPEEVDLLRSMSDHVAIALDRANLLASVQAQAQELQRANQLKDEFLAVLSHELRSPMTPILGWTHLLQTGKLMPDEQRDALRVIEQNARLQSQLIEDLLDISRIMQGKLTLDRAAVNLVSMISAAVASVKLAAEAKKIELQIHLEQTAPIFGDTSRLQQVMRNLLNNAVKFTPERGRVRVELTQVGPQAVIRVMDTGKGIQPQFLLHLFDYFRQEDSSTTRKFGGLGLGLAIVRQIVELHGGTVQAESEGENQGATFTVKLPLAPQLKAAPAQGKLPPVHNTAALLAGIKILVVDDDDTRDFETFLLQESGAIVISAASGQEALQILDQFLPDVLVSDVGMAEMDGYMLMAQIRARPAAQGGEISAIALTAHAREHDQQKALQAGFQMHLSKPISPAKLVQAIVLLHQS
jgi:PAS domain S-box-containing protein